MLSIKIRLSQLIALFAILLLLAACSNNDDEGGSAGGSGGTALPAETGALNSYLTAAINDEYRARDTYQAVMDKFGNVRPFASIKSSEEQHIRQLAGLFNTYGIPVPSDRVGGLSAPSTVAAACGVGVEAEIANAGMYDSLLAGTTDFPDVQAVFKRLQSASLEQHLPAFQRCAD